MQTLKKLTLRHAKVDQGKWTEVANGIRLKEISPKTSREFSSKIVTYSEDIDHSMAINSRVGLEPNNYIAPAIYLCEIDNGFISPRLSKLPRYWMLGNASHYIDDNLNSKWIESIPDGMSASVSDDGSCTVSFTRSVHFNKPVLFLNFFSNTNHLLHESLPALLYLKEIAERHPDYIVHSSPIKPFIKRFLFDIGFPVDRIFESTDCAISAPIIIATCFAAGGHLNNPSSALDETCNVVVDSLPKVYRPGETPKRIYVSRSDASQRILLNEREVTDYLTKEHGFKVVVPGHLSVAQQVEFFSNADIIVGPHGMGINNFAFAKAPSLLMELFQPNWVREAYLRQAQIKGSDYAAYVGKLSDGNLLIDIDKFKKFFEERLKDI